MKGFRRAGADDSTFGRVFRTLGIAAANGVVIYGVLVFGWNAAAVVFLFVAEGVVRVIEDIARNRLLRTMRAAEHTLFVEAAFMLFFGVFALLVYGPYESLSDGIADGFARFGRLAAETRVGILAIAAGRVWHLGRDLVADGWVGRRPRRPLSLHGGPHALLLFFACMLAPLAFRSGPNPMGGLAALLGVKTAGECLLVWIPSSPRRRGAPAREDRPRLEPGPPRAGTA